MYALYVSTIKGSLYTLPLRNHDICIYTCFKLLQFLSRAAKIAEKMRKGSTFILGAHM